MFELPALVLVQTLQNAAEPVGNAFADDVVVHRPELLPDLVLDIAPKAASGV